MLERIIILICSLMCSIPFGIIAIYNKDNKITPIAFWSGSEQRLKKQLSDITGYNSEMAKLFKKCAIAFLLCGLCGLILPIIGYALLGCVCTIGFYFFYKEYKKILFLYTK